MSHPIIKLIPPSLSDKHIKEKIACIRGHRERMFRIEHEIAQDKHIFHNYGHGGAGWTFLPASINESFRQFDDALAHNHITSDMQATVIGAGCYGLLSAIMLARRGFSVTIRAKELHNIPSYKAAGFFFPRARKRSTDEERALFDRYGLESYREYLSMIEGSHPFLKTGARILPGYFGLDVNPGFEPYISAGLMPEAKQVVVDFSNNITHEMLEYQCLFVSVADLMKELTALIHQHAIPIRQEEINSFADIDTPLIFNCAGFGAKMLTGDKKMLPVQGHLITLCNQENKTELNYLINMKMTVTDQYGTRDELLYYAPKDEGVLGITFKRNQSCERANEPEFDRLLKRARAFFGAV